MLLLMLKIKININVYRLCVEKKEEETHSIQWIVLLLCPYRLQEACPQQGEIPVRN